MLIQFTVGNFRSFKDEATLSMEASVDDWLEEGHVFTVDERRLLKSAVIYGANASGKSNFLLAMEVFRDMVQKSSKESQAGEKLPMVPFRLSTETEHAPSRFEVVFLQDGTRYRYGFEATAEAIHSEWLFSQKDSIRETRLFTREGKKIDLSSEYKAEGKGLEARTRANALFLSVVAQFNGAVAFDILEWLAMFRNISGLDDRNYVSFTAQKLREPGYAELITELARKADTGIEKIRATEVRPGEGVSLLVEDLEEQIRKGLISADYGELHIKTFHQKFNAEQKAVSEVEFSLSADESAGTQKFIALTGPLLHTLKHGSILFVDELEARMHPLLTRACVALFNSSANTKNAQLIFATHDEGLLESKQTRRDQVWFVEKDQYGASRLYSLAEFKVRKEAKFAKEYLMGDFGGVPQLGDFEKTLAHARK